MRTRNHQGPAVAGWPHLRQWLATLLAVAILAASFATCGIVSACPFCLSPPQTLAEQISRADLVLIAELVRFEVLDFGRQARSTLRIREYLRGKEIAARYQELQVGQCLHVGSDFSASPGDLFLMYGDLPRIQSDEVSTFAWADDVPGLSGDSPAITQAVMVTRSGESAAKIAQTAFVPATLISWNDTTAVTPAAVQYLRDMPSVDLPQSARLQYYLRFLEHQDPALAIDAWAEFARSTYTDVVAVRSLMSREHLKSWIADPAASPDRLGLYGMMLGLCGTSGDGQFLRQQMLETGTGEFRFGADGLMGGYLMLAGESGLDELDRSFVNCAKPDENSLFAMIQALSFLNSYEPDRISQDRLKQSMRQFLSRPSLREIAITHLARWHDWDALPGLIRIFHEQCDDDRMTQRAILLFASTCKAAGAPGNEASPSPEMVTLATQFLSETSRQQQLLQPQPE